MAGPKASTAAEARDQDRRQTILRAAVEVFAQRATTAAASRTWRARPASPTGSSTTTSRTRMSCSSSVFEAGWSGFVARISEAAEASGTLEQKCAASPRWPSTPTGIDPRGVKVLILEFARSPSRPGRTAGTAFGEVIRLVTRDVRARRGHAASSGPELDPLLGAAMLFGAIEMGLTALRDRAARPARPRLLDRAQDAAHRVLLRGRRPAPLRRTRVMEEATGPLRNPGRPSAPDHRPAGGAQRAVARGDRRRCSRRWPAPRRTRRCGWWCSPARARRRSAPAAISAAWRATAASSPATRGGAGTGRCCSSCRAREADGRAGQRARARRAAWGWCCALRPGDRRRTTRSSARPRSTWGSSR